MTRKETVQWLRARLIGDFTTVQEEILEMVKEATVMFAYSVEDFGEYVTVCYEDEDDEDMEIVVMYEQTGSTWVITDVR